MAPKAPKTAIELFRLALPVQMSTLITLLDALGNPADASVRHYNGALIVEVPMPNGLKIPAMQ